MEGGLTLVYTFRVFLHTSMPLVNATTKVAAVPLLGTSRVLMPTVFATTANAMPATSLDVLCERVFSGLESTARGVETQIDGSNKTLTMRQHVADLLAFGLIYVRTARTAKAAHHPQES